MQLLITGKWLSTKYSCLEFLVVKSGKKLPNTEQAKMAHKVLIKAKQLYVKYSTKHTN